MAVICGMANDYHGIHSRNCGGDMTDIVERLRINCHLIWGKQLGIEAADEIEILRQALADSDNLEEQLMFRIQDQEAEIATLKQQLAEQREINGRLRQEKVNARVYFEQQLADTTWQDHADYWQKRAVVAEQQLADIKREWATADSHKEDYAEKLEQQLAECQAREEHYRSSLEKILRLWMYISPMPSDVLLAFTKSAMEALAMPSDSTALDTMKKQWQREALLEAKELLLRSCPFGSNPQAWYVNEIEKMAKELE
jgi:hypothetical protein